MEKCVKFLDALVLVKIAVEMVNAMVLLIRVHVMKDGLASVVIFPTVQVLQTALTEAFVTRHWNLHHVPTAPLDGWAQDVAIHASMEDKYRWTVATVCVFLDILESAVTVNVLNMVKWSKENVSATMNGVVLYVRIQDVQE